MNRNTWKKGEERIARMFKSHRTPLSGGNSRHTRADVIHEILFVEVKHKKKQIAERLWNSVLDQAKKENKIPLVVLIKKNHPEPLILCKISDIKKIAEEIK